MTGLGEVMRMQGPANVQKGVIILIRRFLSDVVAAGNHGHKWCWW